jgi:hypothetical protein
MVESANTVRLSACVIARNEQRRLPACLASVEFCDEIVVVDSGSTDRTVEIARAAGARVLERAWKGFAAQRNMALDAARGEWVLEVDADERITPPLRDEIVALLADPPPQVDNAVMPLRQVFLGRRLGPSALYPSGRVRLLRRDVYRHDERRQVHEGVWSAGPAAYFRGDLEHILAESLREAVRDLRAYSRLESEHLPQATAARAVLVGMLVRPATKFLYRAWLLGGWRDGLPGLVKIQLDCLYDALTWARYLTQRRQRAAAGASGAGKGHFGRTGGGSSGPVKVLAVARGVERTGSARRWLELAARDGADVVLVTDAPAAAGRLRSVPISQRGPLGVLRAIAWADQLGGIEVLAVGSAVGRIAARLLPAHLRGGVAPASLRAIPRELIDAARARR